MENVEMLALVTESPDEAYDALSELKRLEQAGWIDLNLKQLAIPHNVNFEIEDLITGVHYTWHDRSNYVSLKPDVMPAHIFRLVRPSNGDITLNPAATAPDTNR